MVVTIRDATGMWWVEAKAVAEHSTTHRTAHNKGSSGPQNPLVLL